MIIENSMCFSEKIVELIVSEYNRNNKLLSIFLYYNDRPIYTVCFEKNIFTYDEVNNNLIEGDKLRELI